MENVAPECGASHTALVDPFDETSVRQIREGRKLRASVAHSRVSIPIVAGEAVSGDTVPFALYAEKIEMFCSSAMPCDNTYAVAVATSVRRGYNGAAASAGGCPMLGVCKPRIPQQPNQLLSREARWL